MQKSDVNNQTLGTWDHPCAISFFRIHTILHDILGFDTIITRYYTIFSFGKICAQVAKIATFLRNS